jgi:hypothetical protein
VRDDAQRPSSSADPTSYATITAWARSRSPILQKMRFRRVLTVPLLRKSFWAISLSDKPWATRPRASRSRSEAEAAHDSGYFVLRRVIGDEGRHPGPSSRR